MIKEEKRTHDKFYLKKKEVKVKQYFEEIVEIIGNKENKNYIDIGCSNGSFLSFLQKNVGSNNKLVGLDIDSELINYCQDNYKNIDFFLHDISKKAPDNLNGKFDYVTLLGVHNIFDDLDPIIKSCKSFLKESGKLIIFGAFTTSNYDLIARVRIPGEDHLEIGFNRHSLKSIKDISYQNQLTDFNFQEFHMRTKIEKTSDPLRAYHSHFFENDINNSVCCNGVGLLVNQFLLTISK